MCIAASPTEKYDMKSQFKVPDDMNNRDLMAGNPHVVTVAPDTRPGGGRNPFGEKTPEMQKLEDDYYRRHPDAKPKGYRP